MDSDDVSLQVSRPTPNSREATEVSLRKSQDLTAGKMAEASQAPLSASPIVRKTSKLIGGNALQATFLQEYTSESRCMQLEHSVHLMIDSEACRRI